MKEQSGIYEKNICPFCDSDRKTFTISENIKRFYCFNCSVSGSYSIEKEILNEEYKKLVHEMAQEIKRSK